MEKLKIVESISSIFSTLKDAITLNVKTNFANNTIVQDKSWIDKPEIDHKDNFIGFNSPSDEKVKESEEEKILKS